MKKKVLIIGAITAATVLVGGWALAQSAGHGLGGFGPPFMHGRGGMGPGGMMGMHGQMSPGMRGGMGLTQLDPAQIDRAKTDLGITAAQELAWTKYAKTIQDAAAAMKTAREGVDPEAVSKMSPQDRFAFASKMREQGQRQFETVQTAARELLATLDDTQKGKAQTILPGLAFGPGMMHGAGLGGPPFMQGAGPGGMGSGGMGPGMMQHMGRGMGLSMMGMGPGMMGMGPNMATMTQLRDIHALLANHDRIKRTVTNLPDGIRTVTESDDPQIAQLIKSHSAAMIERVKNGDDPGLPIESPALHSIFRDKDKVHTTYETTTNGVVVTQTSSDANTVATLQKHASEVNEFVRGGMTAVHTAMMQNHPGFMGGGIMHGPMMHGAPSGDSAPNAR